MMAAGALCLMLAVAPAGVAQMRAATAVEGSGAPSGFGVVVAMSFLPLDECGTATKAAAALVTLDGAVKLLTPRVDEAPNSDVVADAHYGFPRPLDHPDWWVENDRGTNFWRLKNDGSHRFSWRLPDVYVPTRWSPTGQRVVLRTSAHGKSKMVIADPGRRRLRDVAVPSDWTVDDVVWIDQRRLAVSYHHGFSGPPGLAVIHADQPGAMSTLPFDRLTPGRRDTGYEPRLFWSAAAHRLLIQYGAQGWIVDLGRRRSMRITPGALPPYESEKYDPSWSPDGQRLLLFRLPGGHPAPEEAWLVEIPSMRRHRVAVANFTQLPFVWVPGGHELVTGLVQRPGRLAEQLALIGGDGRIERIVPARWPADMYQFELAPDKAAHTGQGLMARTAVDCGPEPG
jgi:hypothetical protein